MKKFYILMLLSTSYVHSMQGHHNHHHGGGGHGGGMMMHHHHGGGHGGGMMMQGNPGGFQLAPDHGDVGPIILNHNMDPNYIRQLQDQAGFWDLQTNRPILPNRRITVRDIRRLMEINNQNNFQSAWCWDRYLSNDAPFAPGYMVRDYLAGPLTNNQLNQPVSLIRLRSHNNNNFFWMILNITIPDQNLPNQSISIFSPHAASRNLFQPIFDTYLQNFPVLPEHREQPQHHHAHAGAHHNHHHGGGHGGGMMMQGNPGGFQLAPDHGDVGPIILNHNMDPNHIRQLQAEAGFWDLQTNRPILPNRRITVRDIRRLLEINNTSRRTAFRLSDWDQYVINYIYSALTNAQLNQELLIEGYAAARRIFFYSPLNYGNLQNPRSLLRFDCNIPNPQLLNGRQDIFPINEYQPPAQPAFQEMIPFYPQPQHHHAHAGAHHNHHHGGGGHGGGFMGGGGGFADPVLAPHAQLLNQIGQHNAAHMMAFLLDPQAMNAWINNQRQQMDTNMNTYANFLNVIENQPSFFCAEVERFLTRFPIAQLEENRNRNLAAENIGDADVVAFKMTLSVMKDAKSHGIEYSENKANQLLQCIKSLFKQALKVKRAELAQLPQAAKRFKMDQDIFMYENAVNTLGDNFNGTIPADRFGASLHSEMRNLTLKKALFYICEEAIYRLIHDDESAPKQKMFTFFETIKNMPYAHSLYKQIESKNQEANMTRRQKIRFKDSSLQLAIKEILGGQMTDDSLIRVEEYLQNFYNDQLKSTNVLKPMQASREQAKNTLIQSVIESFAKPIAQYLHSVVRAHTGDRWSSIRNNNSALEVRLNNNNFVIANFDIHETEKWKNDQSLRSYLLSKVPGHNQTFNAYTLEDDERQVIESTLQKYASFERGFENRISCEHGTMGRVLELISDLLNKAAAIGGKINCQGDIE